MRCGFIHMHHCAEYPLHPSDCCVHELNLADSVTVVCTVHVHVLEVVQLKGQLTHKAVNIHRPRSSVLLYTLYIRFLRAARTHHII